VFHPNLTADSDRSSMNVHLRVHTVEGSYLCDVCNKMFRGTGSLKYFSVYIVGSFHIAVICTIKLSAMEVA